MSTRSSSIGRIVAACSRHPVMVVVLALVLTAAALVFTARNFAMTADVSKLISPQLEWRKRELAFEAAFPQFNNLTLIVVDAATPELAESASRQLAAALEKKPELFHSVRRPDAGPFFEREGLLLLPLDQVRTAMAGLGQMAPFLALLNADPSLRGVVAAMATAAQGVQSEQGSLDSIGPMVGALADAIEKTVAGQPAYFSWQAFVAGAPTEARVSRRVILVQPVLDYAELQPGAASSAAIRETARALGLDPAHGVTVRLTGPVPLGDEEFVSLAQDADIVLAAMVVSLLGILWLAVRSIRVVLAIVITTLVGLAMTTALGLWATGRFNLISVAFIPLFVGLGVDFSIQFSVRSLAERLVQPTREAALIAAGAGIGRALVLSAVAIGVGFFAFLPTSYLGVAELGTVAGLGMIVALVLSVALLPALLVLLRFPATQHAEVGFTLLAPVDRFVTRHRVGVLGTALLAAVVSAAMLPFVRFDFDPFHLKSHEVESMTTLKDLVADPDWTPYTINILRPSLAEADALARRLAELPEVRHTITLQSFIPADQEKKLEAIGETAELLGPALDEDPRYPPPTDEELRQSLKNTAGALRKVVADAKPGPATASVRRLAEALDRLEAAPADARERAAAIVKVPLTIVLDQVRQQLKASEVTRETLPADLVADWVTKDGRARIQVTPADGRYDNDYLRRFATAVQRIAPDATGAPIYTQASGDSVVDAFLQAGLFSFVAIVLLLALVLRRVRDVVLTILPVLLSGLLTFATCAALDLPLNFANIIALPLLFGVGVAFNIYFVMAWRRGETAMLRSSLMRAVVFSALTTASAFGALWLSTHPGTATMGRLLMISLGWEIFVTLVFRPALLAHSPNSKLWF